MKFAASLCLAALIFTSACAMQTPGGGAQSANLPYNPPIGDAAVAPLPSASGLQERQPDLCGAKNYVAYLGQPGAVIPTLGVTKAYRVVEFRGIEPQNYDPQRIVFRLDAAGNIQNIDCG